MVPFFLSLLGGKCETSGNEFRGFDTLYLHKYSYRKYGQVCSGMSEASNFTDDVSHRFLQRLVVFPSLATTGDKQSH